MMLPLLLFVLFFYMYAKISMSKKMDETSCICNLLYRIDSQFLQHTVKDGEPVGSETLTFITHSAAALCSH